MAFQNLQSKITENYRIGGAMDRSTPPEWEFFDLEKDPHEMQNVYGDPVYADVVVALKAELERLRDELGDYE